MQQGYTTDIQPRSPSRPNSKPIIHNPRRQEELVYRGAESALGGGHETIGGEWIHRANFADVDGEDVQHLTRGVEDLVPRGKFVVRGGVPGEFGEEGYHGFVAALGGALGIVGLVSDVSKVDTRHRS